MLPAEVGTAKTRMPKPHRLRRLRPSIRQQAVMPPLERSLVVYKFVCYNLRMRKASSRAETAEARALWRSVRALVRRFSVSERAEVSCCGMTVAQAAALEALAAGAETRPGDLARSLGIHPSTATRNLDRLEERSLVERVEDGEDARAARVRLTDRGRRAAVAIEDQTDRFAERILAEIAPERRRPVLASLEELLAAVRRATESCCPGAFDHLTEEPAPETAPQRRGR